MSSKKWRGKWPPDTRNPERAVMELMDLTFWAKQQNLEEIAKRLEWATAVINETIFPQSMLIRLTPTATNARFAAWDGFSTQSAPRDFRG